MKLKRIIGGGHFVCTGMPWTIRASPRSFCSGHREEDLEARFVSRWQRKRGLLLHDVVLCGRVQRGIADNS
eukprot:364454-Lingulodinium_polyedra.AAC.1